jgi:hypothetical protein
MDKKPLIGVSICAVVLLILGSLSNVVGYQSVQSSNQQIINEEINQRELLFQTICDITNNKEIQRIILKSQMSRGIFPTSDIPVLTKNQLKRMYFIGLILSKFISKAKIQSMVHKDQLITPEIQQEINAIIEKDSLLKDEIIQLVNSDCDCEKTEWGFPIICTTLLIMMGLVFIPWLLLMIFLMIPPSALDEMLDLLALFLEPLLVLYQRFNCPIPEGNDFPYISDISPANGEQNVLLNLTELRFRLTDPEGDPMSYKVTTSPYIGEGNGTLVPNGTYIIPIHGLQPSTSYSWQLYLYAGEPTGTPLAPTYTFTTAPLAPDIGNPSPKHNAQYVPISQSNVSFDLKDFQGDLMNWTVETQPNIGSGGAQGIGNGQYTVAISGLEYDKKYTWFVNATDGTYWTRKTYNFSTTYDGLMVLEPRADTMVYAYQPNDNWGSMYFIETYNNNRSLGMVLFNLSGIPAGSTIISANLSLFYYEYTLEIPVGREITCHRILEHWDEMTVTFNTMPDSNPVKCANMTVPENYTWVNWNVTSEVDDFINHGAVNNGWMLRDNKPYSTHNINECYYSSDAAGHHPRLFIWFDSPSYLI